MTGKELYNILLKEIREGRITGMLPSISQMKLQYRTSHNTIHMALDRLKMQGIVYGHQGKGVFVNSDGLRESRKGTVLFYLGSSYINTFVRNPFYGRMLIALKYELQQAGLELVLNSELDDPQKKYSAAIIPYANLLGEQELKLLNFSLPGRICLLNHKMAGCVCVCNDNFRGGWLAVERLYAAGHRHLAVLTAYLDMPYNFFHDRYRGVLAFLRKHRDLRIAEFPVSKEAERQKVSWIAEEILRNYPDITGAFTFKEFYAYAMYQFFSSAGREISLVGYGDPEYAEFMVPQLTTIAENPVRLAQMLAQTVCRQIAGEPVKNVDIPVELIERSTVHPTAGRGMRRSG